jgi:hypothetical protein
MLTWLAGIYGDKDTKYATAIAWLAKVYKAQGRYAEAEPLYEPALAISRDPTED